MKTEEKKITPFKLTEKSLIINGQDIPLKIVRDIKCSVQQANPTLPMSLFLVGLLCFLFAWQLGIMLCLIALAWVFANSPTFFLIIETPDSEVKILEEKDEEELQLIVKSIRAELLKLQERKIRIQKEKEKEREMKKLREMSDKIFFSL